MKRRHEAWDGTGHNWTSLAYRHDDGRELRPAFWWRCLRCQSSGYGGDPKDRGTTITVFLPLAITDGTYAKLGWKPITA